MSDAEKQKDTKQRDAQNQGYTRTDLACEWGKQNAHDTAGVEFSERRWAHGTLQRLRVCTQEAAARLRRSMGEYITVSCGKIWTLDHAALQALEETVSRLLVQLLKSETGREPGSGSSVLVVGLGNRAITADAIGPLTVDELLVTRHLRRQEPRVFHRMDCCSVSALAPGVLGQTGMEAWEVVRGAVQHLRPDAVVAIDALAARSCERLAATVQLTSSGIAPGAGIDNNRQRLGRDSLGIPVIALGVPTVVDSSTLVWDALSQAGLSSVAGSGKLRALLDNGKRFYVSPKEADLITQKTAQLLARAINRALVGVPSV